MSLKDMRKSAGLTQTEAANLFGLKYRTYQNYENNVTSPDMDTASKFARFFKCTIGELFDLEEGQTAPLSFEEQQLIDLFSDLNDEGKAKLLDYASDLNLLAKYREKEVHDSRHQNTKKS